MKDCIEDVILSREMENDGRNIHLYYFAETGFYVAYGFSAFFASHIVEVVTSFSEDMRMPVVFLRRSELPELLRVADGPTGDYGDYALFTVRKSIPLDGYQRWVEKVRATRYSVHRRK